MDAYSDPHDGFSRCETANYLGCTEGPATFSEATGVALSLPLRESVQLARGTDIDGIVGKRRRRGHTFTELRVPGEALRLGRARFQDRHGPILERCKV